MKHIYQLSDEEILAELFAGMTQADIDAYVEKVYASSERLTPDALRKQGLL